MSHGEDAFLGSSERALIAQFETSSSSCSIDEISAPGSKGPLKNDWRCQTQLNLTGASLSSMRRKLARARRLALNMRTADAVALIDQIELQLDDLPLRFAKRFRVATQLLRAVVLAFRDESSAALAVAESRLVCGEIREHYVTSTISRLASWQLGQYDLLHALPPRASSTRRSKSRATSAMLDLSIEAAVALDHLHLSTAKRLAMDASNIAETVPKVAGGLAALPACLIAQVHYEEGDLDEAERILRGRLPTINAEGSVECVLRTYLVLTRIAKQRTQTGFAAVLLREAETLGEVRGWPRLVAACLVERTSLLLSEGRIKEAQLVVEYLERYAETHRKGSEYSSAEVSRYSMLARLRVSWAGTPTIESAAALRKLYHGAVDQQKLYAASRLAVELAEMLAAIGEPEGADALFLRTLKSAAAVGLYQLFLEGGEARTVLLTRAYDNASAPGWSDREVPSFIGSLLSRCEARRTDDRHAQPGVSDVLTVREREIITLIGQGFANKRIARSLEISPETVKSHLKRSFLKLAVSTRSEAVSRATSFGLL